jgi:hypothetical protein
MAKLDKEQVIEPLADYQKQPTLYTKAFYENNCTKNIFKSI